MDITLEIDHDGDNYLIRLKQEGRPPVEQAFASSIMVESAWPPDKIKQHILGVPIDERGGKKFDEISRVLGGWLFPQGKLRDEWEKLVMTQRYAEVRLWLQFPKESKLAELPWELAKTPNGIRLGSTCGVCRLVDPVHGQEIEKVWPLRILLLAGGEDLDGTLGIKSELVAIKRALLPFGRSIEVVNLDRPTRQQLSEMVREFKPHVLHFAGHGKEDLNGEPGLNFESPPPQGSWLWSGKSILPDLHDWDCIPRFVFLNACRTASGDSGSRTAQRKFREAGSLGAIAMQADMPGDLAGVFAATFYQEIVHGLTISEASRKARQAILDHSNDEALRINYAIPRVEAPLELRLLNRPALPQEPAFESCVEFSQARFFGNCSTERRQATKWFNPQDASFDGNGVHRKPVLLILGESRSGKSHFLKWCMETWSLGEARIRYIELHERSMTFLDVLRQIRIGETDLRDEKYHFLHAPLPPEPFRRYRWELENLLTKGVPGEWVEEERIADQPLLEEKGSLPANGDKRLEPIISACFREALKAAAEDRPILLVFDRFSGDIKKLQSEDFKQLVQHLFKPLVTDPRSNVKLVFCSTAAEYHEFGLSFFPEECRVVVKTPASLGNDELVECAKEADFFRNPDVVGDIARILLKAPNDLHLSGLGRLGPLQAALVAQGLSWERMI